MVLVKQPVMAKTTTKKAPEWDIFDVPPSDDEAPLWRPNKPRPAPLSRAKAAFTSRTVAQPSPEPSNDSDDSNTSKKRKRQGSISSSATVKAAQVERECEPSVLHRNKKYQKKEDSVSPGHDTSKVSLPIQAVEEQPRGFAINKPKRTRTRTVPVQAKPPIAKGQSSPATLSGMLAVRSLPKPSPVPEVSEVQAAEDETMYDIPDPETPVVKLRKAPISGSVTPRQNALFSNLLGDSAESATPMPSISRLRLTDQRPSSVLAGLTRSSSDIPQSALTRKTRLIDMLKQSAPSSDDDSESDEETEEDIPEIPAVSVPAKTAANGVGATDDASDEMDVDSEAQVDSQASQTTVQLHSGARITYAKQRSYLEESNLEDGLLLAMGLDDDFGPNKDQNLVSEDEDDPASQVRGIHELRRQGQHYKFQVEAENSIDDISGKSGLNASQRRSAMMDFATRMADRTFIDQLLESALTYRLLESISYAREIIFDFAAAVAVLHILETGPGYTVLDQMYQSGIMVTLSNLLDSHNDIYRIARDRKTNMAKSAQGTVAEFRDLILKSSVWPAEKLEKVSPQLVAMKTLELLILGIRKAGNDEALIDEDTIAKLVSITRNACQRLKVGKATSQDLMTLDIAFSILEAVSLSKDGQTTWSNEVLRRLAEIMPVFFETSGASPIRLVVRLCMNITNNKPKACQSFAGPTFVLPLVRSISHRFKLLAGELDEQQRTEVMEGLILSLGAMINLAEFSDQARMSVVQEGDGLVDELAQIFLDGSERADRVGYAPSAISSTYTDQLQADSMEESQSSVTIGYLSILLGNLCLNDTVRAKVQSRLPRNKIDILVQKVKEFVLYNQKVDRLAGQFEGEEGRETLRNFTMRLMLVVERLEKVGA